MTTCSYITDFIEGVRQAVKVLKKECKEMSNPGVVIPGFEWTVTRPIQTKNGSPCIPVKPWFEFQIDGEYWWVSHKYVGTPRFITDVNPPIVNAVHLANEYMNSVEFHTSVICSGSVMPERFEGVLISVLVDNLWSFPVKGTDRIEVDFDRSRLITVPCYRHVHRVGCGFVNMEFIDTSGGRIASSRVYFGAVGPDGTEVDILHKARGS